MVEAKKILLARQPRKRLSSEERFEIINVCPSVYSRDLVDCVHVCSEQLIGKRKVYVLLSILLYWGKKVVRLHSLFEIQNFKNWKPLKLPKYKKRPNLDQGKFLKINDYEKPLKKEERKQKVTFQNQNSG